MMCSFEASGPCRGLVPGARGEEAPQQRAAIEAGEETETGKEVDFWVFGTGVERKTT